MKDGPLTIEPDVHAAAAHFGLDPLLIQAVVQAEGNIVKAVQCSVPSVETRDKALEVLCRSCVHALRDFVTATHAQSAFIDFWASRWAPVGAANDPRGLNTNWTVNVKKLSGLVAMLLVCVLGLPATVSAQDGPSGQTFARGMSWGALGAGVALKAWDISESDEKLKEALKSGGALLITGLSTLAAKTLVHEDRPCAPNDCGPDDPHKAFWSGHVGNACAVIPLHSGKAMLITGVALAVVTAAGRFIGKEHWLFPDITLGCVDGLLNNWLMSKIR